MDAERVPVTLYMDTQVLIGFIYRPYEERLLDLFNGIFVRRPENRGRFVEVIDITIHHPDGRRERLPVAYINKSIIQLAAVSDGDPARGIGGKVGYRYPPFVQKSQVPVRLRTPAYVLLGSMHCSRGQKIWHVLQEKAMFLPVTNVRIDTRRHKWHLVGGSFCRCKQRADPVVARREAPPYWRSCPLKPNILNEMTHLTETQIGKRPHN